MSVDVEFHRKTTEERENELIIKYPLKKFNWRALLFGSAYYLYHGMWKKAVLYSLISIVTAGIGAIPLLIYMGFRHNKHYLEHYGINLDARADTIEEKRAPSEAPPAPAYTPIPAQPAPAYTPIPVAGSSKFCQNCGQSVSGLGKFCNHCGQNLE